MKTNLLQPRNLTQYSEMKVTTDCCDPNETLSDTKDSLIDITEAFPKNFNIWWSPGSRIITRETLIQTVSIMVTTSHKMLVKTNQNLF